MIYVVSGLPRTGTTMMMRMLEVGGIEPYYDKGDPLCDVLRETWNHSLLPGDSSWMIECEGKALKILLPCLRTPPREYEYRFIWMDRSERQRAKSHLKFVRKIHGREPTAKFDIIRKSKRYRKQSLKLLRSYGSPLMIMRFEEVLHDPRQAAEKVALFLQRDLNVDLMERSVIARSNKCLPYLLEERLVYAEI